MFDPACRSVADIGRRHVEDFKIWQAARPGKRGKSLSTTTIRHRLGLLRTFFERIIEWGYDDAPARVPIFPGDFPKPDEPLPKFLDDPTMAKFMAAVTADPNPRRRLMIELLARTGMRVGELAALEDEPWSRSARPSGCASRWASSTTTATCRSTGAGRSHRRLPTHTGTESVGSRLVPTVTTASPSIDGRSTASGGGGQAGGHPTDPSPPAPPHARHQAINRGMSLEAIAALLGHKSMRMTMTYARISDRTVSDEYSG